MTVQIRSLETPDAPLTLSDGVYFISGTFSESCWSTLRAWRSSQKDLIGALIQLNKYSLCAHSHRDISIRVEQLTPHSSDSSVQGNLVPLTHDADFRFFAQMGEVFMDGSFAPISVPAATGWKGIEDPEMALSHSFKMEDVVDNASNSDNDKDKTLVWGNLSMRDVETASTEDEHDEVVVLSQADSLFGSPPPPLAPSFSPSPTTAVSTTISSPLAVPLWFWLQCKCLPNFTVDADLKVIRTQDHDEVYGFKVGDRLESAGGKVTYHEIRSLLASSRVPVHLVFKFPSRFEHWFGGLLYAGHVVEQVGDTGFLIKYSDGKTEVASISRILQLVRGELQRPHNHENGSGRCVL